MTAAEIQQRIADLTEEINARNEDLKQMKNENLRGQLRGVIWQLRKELAKLEQSIN